MSSETNLIISEVFGPTIQGEGPSAGHKASFIRLGGCNLTCVWCDTPYTWDWTRFNPRRELHRRTVKQLVDDNRVKGDHLVVITGGEPMLQVKRLGDLIAKLAPRRVEIETNGTIPPAAWFNSNVSYNVSPKLENSGVAFAKRRNDDVLSAYVNWRSAIFKFVASSPDDLQEVDDLVKKLEIPVARVYIMPEAIDVETLDTRLKALADGVMDRGYVLRDRLHIRLWGNIRGV